MITEISLHAITQRVCALLECSNTLLSLTPPSTHSHSLPDMFTAPQENALASLLAQEEVQVLLSCAVQERSVQSCNDCTLQFHHTLVKSVAIAPLERPAGLLGFLICMDTQADKFLHGEYALLEQVIPRIARELESVLCNTLPVFALEEREPQITTSTQADLTLELQKHYLDIIMEQAEHMETLINNLHNISRIMGKNISTELSYYCERQSSLL